MRRRCSSPRLRCRASRHSGGRALGGGAGGHRRAPECPIRSAAGKRLELLGPVEDLAEVGVAITLVGVGTPKLMRKSSPGPSIGVRRGCALLRGRATVALALGLPLAYAIAAQGDAQRNEARPKTAGPHQLQRCGCYPPAR